MVAVIGDAPARAIARAGGRESVWCQGCGRRGRRSSGAIIPRCWCCSAESRPCPQRTQGLLRCRACSAHDPRRNELRLADKLVIFYKNPRASARHHVSSQSRQDVGSIELFLSSRTGRVMTVRGRILDADAGCFTSAFYRHVAKGDSVPNIFAKTLLAMGLVASGAATRDDGPDRGPSHDGDPPTLHEQHPGLARSPQLVGRHR